MLPEMEPGAEGSVPVVSVSVLADEVPQELVPVTVMLPAVAVGVTEMLFVVELPVQPEGNVQE